MSGGQSEGEYPWVTDDEGNHIFH